MTAIDQLKTYGFQINWTLLALGYDGFRGIPPQLTTEDILKYAADLIEQMHSNYESIVDLFTKIPYDFRTALNNLVNVESVSKQLQIEKWEVLIVANKLQNLPIDCTNGLLELTEMWISLGLPSDTPHIIQGKNNQYTPKEYYSSQMYHSLIKKHKEWLYQKVRAIIQLES